MGYAAPRTGSAPAFLDSSEAATGADPYGSAYGSYGAQNPQMFGSAYSGVFPAGPGDAFLAAAAAEGTPSTSQPGAADWTQQ